jgi:uncharacterized integral membrane protein
MADGRQATGSAEQAEPFSAESPAQPGPTEPAPSLPESQPAQVQEKPSRTRTAAAFNGFVAGAIVLILLLIFILENTQRVTISYFGASGHLALGIALLIAAGGGALLVGVLGAARIAQVRRHAKRLSRFERQ